MFSAPRTMYEYIYAYNLVYEYKEIMHNAHATSRHERVQLSRKSTHHASRSIYSYYLNSS